MVLEAKRQPLEHRANDRREQLQLLDALLPEEGEGGATPLGEVEPDDPAVLDVGDRVHETGRLCSLHEADGAVVAQQQGVCHIADRRTPGVPVAADGDEQLMLGRCQPDASGQLLAPPEEAAQPRPRGKEAFIVRIVDVVGRRVGGVVVRRVGGAVPIKSPGVAHVS